MHPQVRIWLELKHGGPMPGACLPRSDGRIAYEQAARCIWALQGNGQELVCAMHGREDVHTGACPAWQSPLQAMLGPRHSVSGSTADAAERRAGGRQAFGVAAATL
jgi:hypothetical protein